MPARVTRGALIGLTSVYLCVSILAAEPRSTAVIFSLLLSQWNDLDDPIFDGVGLAGFKSRANAYLLAQASRSLFVLVLWSWGLCTDGVNIALSQACVADF